jgi:hypothetical protein
MNLTKLGWLLGLAAMVMISLACTSASASGDEVNLSDCPAAVQKTFERETSGAKIEEVEKEIVIYKTTYEAEVTIDEKEYEITVAEDGTLLEKSLEEDDENDEDKEGDEVEIKLADCPAAVQKTLKREAMGGGYRSCGQRNQGRQSHLRS